VAYLVTRVVKWEFSRSGVLRSLMDMYTDDIFGVCFRRDLAYDMDKAQEFCRQLLGSTSIEERKTESRRRLTIAGVWWSSDLVFGGHLSQEGYEGLLWFLEWELGRLHRCKTGTSLGVLGGEVWRDLFVHAPHPLFLVPSDP